MVSCPVAGSESTLPATLTMIPCSGDLATRYSASRVPNGFSRGVAKNIEPSIWPSTSGLSITSSPTLESLGQPAPGAELTVSAANWASEQVPRPEATDGLTDIPSGSVTRPS